METFRVQHLVSDYNGTLAEDGRLLPGVAEALVRLSTTLAIHVLTADTFGIAAQELAGLPIQFNRIDQAGQHTAKKAYVEDLGSNSVVAIGNGRNDRAMLSAAALGIAVLQGEGTSVEALHSATILCRSTLDALNLLIHPNRLAATLRS